MGPQGKQRGDMFRQSQACEVHVNESVDLWTALRWSYSLASFGET